MSVKNNDFIPSKLDSNANAFLKESVPVDQLIKGYKDQFDIDIKKYFDGIKDLKIYECESTSYRFFFPYSVAGDGALYESLQKYEWYYMPWKWEHLVTEKILSGHEKVLEIGSGGLGFVEKLHNNGFDITGLELNEESVVKANTMGLNVVNQTVESHSINNFEKYDVVCSYQVLEHISEVNSFIQSQIDCLKVGGKLIISVPNNNSFIKHNKGGLLNFPPHHMGLWDKESLSSLVEIFKLKVDKILYEPLQNYHLDWYVSIILEHVINKNRIFKFAFKKLGLIRPFRYLINLFKGIIHGHSILVIYIKT